MPKISALPPIAALAGADEAPAVDTSAGSTGKFKMSDLLPAGVIMPYGGAAAPSGFLLCTGQAVSRSTYADLFAAIGTAFGAGNGSSTFNVPDMRGRSLVGVGTGTFAESVANTAVNTTTDQITVSAAAGVQLLRGTPVVLTTTGTAPGGLTAGTTYYVIPVDSTHIKLATSAANAGKNGEGIAENAIDLTSQGTGTHTLTMTLTSRALGDRGGEEQHYLSADEQASMYLHKEGGDFINQDGGGPKGGWDNLTGNTNQGQVRSVAVGGFKAHNNMQPYIATNYIIKT